MMTQPGNSFKANLHKKKLIGLWVSLCSPASAEICARSGADWVLVDMEHAPNEVAGVADQLRAAEHATAVIVRPPESTQTYAKRLLDIGVKTIMFPMIDTPEQAKAVVSWTRYPPHGIRGISGVIRASDYGRDSQYRERLEEEICVIVQAETPQAIANIPAIAAVKGIDAIFIGPGDLSASMGYTGNANAPEVRRVIKEALGTIKSNGKGAGVLGYGAPLAHEFFAEGADFVAVGADTWLLARETAGLVKACRA